MSAANPVSAANFSRNRTDTKPQAAENRTLPTFEEFLEFILVSSMEGKNRGCRMVDFQTKQPNLLLLALGFL
jgi:hypothetical protein